MSTGLAAAVHTLLPEARRQRCTVHLQRNVGAKVPHRLRKRVAPEVSAVFNASGLAKAIDEVRAKEAKNLKAAGYEPVLKSMHFCLLKRPDNLTDNQEIKLAELLRYNFRTVHAYLPKEDFQFFWDYLSPAWAGKFLDRWCIRTMRSKLEPMKRVARMLRNHRTLLLNWFHARGEISPAAVEGLNNKLKVTTRKAYGFRTLRALEVALYHTLGQLPEANFTHRFC